MKDLIIEAQYDEEARVWVAVNDELGLATEAETLDVLTYKLQEMVPELATLNKVEVVGHRTDCSDVPYSRAPVPVVLRI